mgnify:CR=1 FL=1
MTSKKRFIISSVFIFVFTIVTILGFRVTKDNVYNPAAQAEKKILEVAAIKQIDKGREIYYLNIDQVDENYNTLLFYTNHQEVFVYSKDKLIYSLESADSIYGRTPGAVWNMIFLPSDTRQVEVHVSQVYPELAKQVPEFEFGNAMKMYREVLNDAATEIILSCAIIVIGVALCLYWVLVFGKGFTQTELLYLGLFAIIFGIWNLGETQFAVFMFENRAVFSYLAFTCLMTMGLPALYFFKDFLEVEDKIVYKLFSAYIISETVICQILHFTGIKGVKETANFTVVNIVLIMVYLLYAIIKGLLTKKNVRKIIVNIVGLTILAITAVIDIGTYYTNLLTAEKVAKVGFLIYAVVLGIETTRIARKRLQEEQKMEILKEMAEKDLLTGCYNRNAFSEVVSELTDLNGVQIIGFDLNDLKKCNDTKGHKAGDTYIKDASTVIQKTFGAFGKVYRVGGDEFCIITKDLSDLQLEKAKALLQLSVAHYRLENPESGFGIACGYATYDPQIDADFESIRHRADILMYENKKEIKK